MKRGKNLLPIILVIAIFIFSATGIIYASVNKNNAWHPASSFALKIDGTDRTLAYAVTNNIFKTTHTYASPTSSSIPNPGHSATDIWVSVDGNEGSLFNLLSEVNGLCGSSATSSYSSVPDDSDVAYHLASEIEISSGKSFQDAIDTGDFCCVPKTCADYPGEVNPALDDGCGGMIECCASGAGKSCGAAGCGGITMCDGTCTALSYSGSACGPYKDTCSNRGTYDCDGNCIGTSLDPDGTSCQKCTINAGKQTCVTGACKSGVCCYTKTKYTGQTYNSCDNCVDDVGLFCSTRSGNLVTPSPCGGYTQCDGTCSITQPSNYDQPCGSCGGKIRCDGTCSVATPSNYGDSCGANACTNAGTIDCNGNCVGTSPKSPINGKWSDWGTCSAKCTFGDGKTGSKCGTWTTSGTQYRFCNNPSPSCGGSDCSGVSSQSCASPSCTATCLNGYWCNKVGGTNSGTCATCSCIGNDLVLCGTIYDGPCDLKCLGTKCASGTCINGKCCTPSCPTSASGYVCGVSYSYSNGCGGTCTGTGNNCLTGSCHYCSSSKGCGCVGGICKADYGDYYCD